ncbi:MAG: M18 family aminopeptidase [Parachlamydiaceae bacterium]
MKKKTASQDENAQLLEGLRDFIHHSPTSWHAILRLKEQLLSHGFIELDPSKEWILKPKGRYFTDCQGSTLSAFILPSQPPSSACILGTHTDSPALKLKPQPEFIQDTMIMFGVEVYGGPLLNSWLNRDLGLAGRIFYTNESAVLQETLIQIENAPLIIPQLAIHLDREIHDKGLQLNRETHLAALAGVKTQKETGRYLDTLLRQHVPFDRLISHDLFLYPLEKTAYLGPNQQLLAGYRLDNLCSVHAALTAITHSHPISKDGLRMAVFWDHEEVGSRSSQGAESPFLPHLLERILLGLQLSREHYFRLLSQSRCISIDLTHASNPNYLDKYEKLHRPLLNQGITLKFSAQQRYATSSHTSAPIVALCEKLKLPLQKFVTRNDIPGGTTIGPLTATLTGIPTVDLGIPQLSMHSTREVIGCQDHLDMCRLLSSIL